MCFLEPGFTNRSVYSFPLTCYRSVKYVGHSEVKKDHVRIVISLNLAIVGRSVQKKYLYRVTNICELHCWVPSETYQHPLRHDAGKSQRLGRKTDTNTQISSKAMCHARLSELLGSVELIGKPRMVFFLSLFAESGMGVAETADALAWYH